MSMILGVDGGNTKTIALLATPEGRIIGAARGGCTDIYGASSPQAALDEIERTVDQALVQADTRREDLDTACFSLAGADWPEDYAFLRQAMQDYGFGRMITVCNDSLGALRAGSPDGTGVVISCGTGIAAAARNPNGVFWHSGFWQEPLCGIELGNQALRVIYRSELGIDPTTSLTDQVLRHFGHNSVEALLHHFTRRGGVPPTGIELSKLAPMVLREADAGDTLASQIVNQHGTLLADYALAAARKVHLEQTTFRLVLNGGVFRHPGQKLVDAIKARINLFSPDVVPMRSRHEPVLGAVLLALETAGIQITPMLLHNLEQSRPSKDLFRT
jgi:N-acetylglucosamine kinase-like BadF-type ATPase